MILLSVQSVIWLFAAIVYKQILYKATELAILMYLTYIIVAIFPLASIYWKMDYPIVCSWYFVVLVGAMAFQVRKIGILIALVVLAMIAVLLFYDIFPTENFTPSLIKTGLMLTVISILVLTIWFVIILAKRHNIDEAMQTETIQKTVENAKNTEKYNALYNEIIEYLEKEQPFKNPDFNVRTLADALNTNVYYISKAISEGEGQHQNFFTVLNRFRINYAKSLIDDGAMKKYTLHYIYSEAGYKHRPTFNRIFKSITGVTPSDYVSQKS
jgi:AraC-like DNA-binding protein